MTVSTKILISALKTKIHVENYQN